jgi:hypothetical protein
LTGTVSYLAAAETNTTFSEYVLYEPILRILMVRGYLVTCELRCPGLPRKNKQGDYKRLDFEAIKKRKHFALEVKWPRPKQSPRPRVRTFNIQRDHLKLVAFRNKNPKARCFFCLFGRYNDISRAKLKPNQYSEALPAIYALFGRTQYGCRIYALK